MIVALIIGLLVGAAIAAVAMDILVVQPLEARAQRAIDRFAKAQRRIAIERQKHLGTPYIRRPTLGSES